MTFPKLPSPIRFATAIVLVTTITAVQTVAAQEASAVTDAIRRIQSDDLGSQPENRLMYVNILASARAVEAIPVIESYYARITDAEIKAGVASALVRLGDKKDIYRDYFVADAIKHIRSNNVGQGPVDAMSYVNPIANAGAAEGIRFSRITTHEQRMPKSRRAWHLL